MMLLITATMTNSSLAVIIIYLKLVIDINMCTIINVPSLFLPHRNVTMYKYDPNLSNLTESIVSINKFREVITTLVMMLLHINMWL